MPDTYYDLFAKHLGPGVRATGSEYRFRCYKCDSGGERHLYVNTNTGAFHCFRCESRADGARGNAFTFAKEMGDTAPIEVEVEERVSLFNQEVATTVYTHMFNEGKLTLSDQDRKDLLEKRSIRNPEKYGLVSSTGARKWLKGWSEDALIESGMGYHRNGLFQFHTCVEDGRLLIPYIEEDGSIPFFRSRGKNHAKYLGPIGNKTSGRVWGKIDPKQSYVIITEGELKAISAREERFHCLALPGMGISHIGVADKIKESGIKQALICFDVQVEHMDAVEAAERKLASQLIRRGVSTYKVRLPLVKCISCGQKVDIDSFLTVVGSKDFLSLVKQAEKIKL